jgi:uncharacterized protein YqgV (UPF0045/DUF77 family)
MHAEHAMSDLPEEYAIGTNTSASGTPQVGSMSDSSWADVGAAGRIGTSNDLDTPKAKSEADIRRIEKNVAECSAKVDSWLTAMDTKMEQYLMGNKMEAVNRKLDMWLNAMANKMEAFMKMEQKIDEANRKIDHVNDKITVLTNAMAQKSERWDGWK